jgi:triosephosphate isomerase
MSLLRKVFVGGNWKSIGDLAFAEAHVNNVIKSLVFDTAKCEVSIAPTSLHLLTVKQLVEKHKLNILVTSQNVSMFPEGAYTGEVTAKMLKNAGINWTIIGHSERRQYFGESDDVVGKKVKLSLDNGVSVIACIGEKLDERESGKTMDVCLRQLNAIIKNVNNWDGVVIAYEPVWAIGTGKTASNEQAQEVHGELRNYLDKNVSKDIANKVRIIYGGSVTDANAKDLIKQNDIDGFLVGGASLKPGFKTIVDAHEFKH